jgi:cell pole-organizing protein PopZ
MANPSAAHEPSMEEILASIRQIISEDNDVAPPVRNQPKTQGSAEPESPMNWAPAADEEESASYAEPDSAPSIPPKSRTSETPMKAATQPVASASETRSYEAARPPAVQARRRDDDQNLLSEQSDAAVSGAFSALAHTILAQNARTLEDLVCEMLRPMLKEWLDDNLPSLVERQVQEEIQRVSRGRR